VFEADLTQSRAKHLLGCASVPVPRYQTLRLRLRAQKRSVRALRRPIQEMIMAVGNVKWFNPTKGYGFIQPSDGGKDVFVHISAVERAGLSTLNEGQRVEYELVSNRGKTSAENLKVT
jgi:CspA family cold shock protein